MARFVGIDPSTKTGFVALNAAGKVERAKELTGIGNQDPKRMVTLIDEVMAHLHPDDVICIEGFGFNSQQAIQLGGIGWGLRMALYRRGMKWTNVAPEQVKKFVGVSGWTGEKGSKRRLQGKEKKEAVKEACRNLYNFFHPSDNVNDAFVLAQIARAVQGTGEELLTAYQAEVIEAILNSPEKKRKKVK